MCQSGACTGAIYYTETTALYERYEDEIWRILTETADSQNALSLRFLSELNGAKLVEDAPTLKNLMVWFAIEELAIGILSQCDEDMENLPQWVKDNGAEYFLVPADIPDYEPDSADAVATLRAEWLDDFITEDMQADPTPYEVTDGLRDDIARAYLYLWAHLEDKPEDVGGWGEWLEQARKHQEEAAS